MEKVKIKAQNLNFYYGEFQALKNISLDMLENKVTALIGPSGCGKSTFLRCLNRMNDLIEGSRVEGKLTWMGKIFMRLEWMWWSLGEEWAWFFKNPILFPSLFLKM